MSELSCKPLQLRYVIILSMGLPLFAGTGHRNSGWWCLCACKVEFLRQNSPSESYSGCSKVKFLVLTFNGVIWGFVLNLKTPPLSFLYLLYIPEKILVYSGLFVLFSSEHFYLKLLDIWSSCKAICKVRKHSTKSFSSYTICKSSKLPKTILSFYIR